ncbi:hypothetical protein ACLOJK_037609 [Asimina triloba]
MGSLSSIWTNDGSHAVQQRRSSDPNKIGVHQTHSDPTAIARSNGQQDRSNLQNLPMLHRTKPPSGFSPMSTPTIIFTGDGSKHRRANYPSKQSNASCLIRPTPFEIHQAVSSSEKNSHWACHLICATGKHHPNGGKEPFSSTVVISAIHIK